MAKRGRPKKENVARYDCGKVDLRQDPRARDVGEFQHMKDMVKSEALHPAWVCELWRLHHLGRIRNHEREAGDMWVRLSTEHSKQIEGSPPQFATVSKLERGYSRIELDPEVLDSEQRKEYDDRLVNLQKRYDAAFCAVIDRQDGVAIMKALNRVCLEDEPVEYQSFILAKGALEILAEHFGLTDKDKRG